MPRESEEEVLHILDRYVCPAYEIKPSKYEVQGGIPVFSVEVEEAKRKDYPPLCLTTKFADGGADPTTKEQRFIPIPVVFVPYFYASEADKKAGRQYQFIASVPPHNSIAYFFHCWEELQAKRAATPASERPPRDILALPATKAQLSREELRSAYRNKLNKHRNERLGRPVEESEDDGGGQPPQ